MQRKLRVVEIAEPNGSGYYIEEYVTTMWVAFEHKDGSVGKRYDNPFDAVEVAKQVNIIRPSTSTTKVLWGNQRRNT